MRRFLLSTCMLSSLALAPLACSVEPESAPVENAEKNEEAIVGGTADTGNKAVMWIYIENQGSACSGTMIAKNGSTGWVLTAGHCSGMTVVVQANNFEDCFEQNNPGCEGVYEVTGDTAHPNWNGDPGNGYDFRILTVAGAANAPVIPPAQNPDGVSNGVQIEAVGYGETLAGNNSLRRHVTETVEDEEPLLIWADQTDGTGSCSGDSGGPILRNGTVVGVTSFGDQNCTQYGAYGRVQAVYSNWIAGIIGGTVMPNCDDCFGSAQQPNGACANEVNACVENQDCLDINECFGPCTTDACFQQCIDQHPTGWQLYSAFITCGCNACATECADECGGSSTSTSTGSGPGPAAATAQNSSSAAAGMGGFGEGASGEGAGDSTGSGKKDRDDDDDDDDEVIDSGCSCATVGDTSNGQGGLLGLAGFGLLAGALLRRRRR